MPVHHCPACELRFRNRTELEYHWAEEHAPPASEQQEVVGDEADVERKQGGSHGHGT